MRLDNHFKKKSYSLYSEVGQTLKTYELSFDFNLKIMHSSKRREEWIYVFLMMKEK